MRLRSKSSNLIHPANFIDRPFYRSNEMKSADTFTDDIHLVKKNIEQIVGQSLNHDDMIEDLQDELDDLNDSREVLDNMLTAAR